MKYLFLFFAAFLLHATARTQGCTTNYVEPDFQIQKTDESCVTRDGQITVVNQTGGIGPIVYRLVETGATNNSGAFTNLPHGLYTVELRDACGTVRTRQVTLVPFSFSFTFNVNKTSNCNDGEVVFTVTPQNPGFLYGVVIQGDTTWSSSSTLSIKLYKKMTVLIKDPCGNIQSKHWTAPYQFLPYIDALQYRLQCDKFDLFPVYYGFLDPEVCLYEYGTNNLVACKSAAGNYTGGPLTNFFDVPWGQYYVIVKDKCYRDSMYHPDMRSAGGSELNPYNWDCTTFSMHVDGMEDTVCLYNAITNQLISCKGQDTVSINPRTGLPWPSGAVWDSLPYGSYYAWIYDPCEDSTFKIDSTVTYPFSIFMSALPGCSLNQTTIQANFSAGSKRPFTVRVYNSDNTLNSTHVTNYYDNYIGVTPDSQGGSLTVVASDACGYSDTAVVQPQFMQFSKSVSLINKCPGVLGTSGSGDVHIHSTTFSHVKAIPTIIKKNGIDTTVNYSFQQNDNYEFANLLSGTYIIEYSFNSCAQLKAYDTVTINDYIYPTQTPDTAIQCGGNMFTFTFPILGGLSPYTFQIIDNTPLLPSLAGSVQATPTFTVGNGQHYTSVKVRAIDRCGNSTIGDIAVQPINGCSVLPVDSVQKNPALASALVKIYPNPSRGQFTVSINQKKKSNYRVQVVNASGIKVYERLLFNVDKKDLVVNQEIPPGFYLVHITDTQSNKTSVFKQVVQ